MYRDERSGPSLTKIAKSAALAACCSTTSYSMASSAKHSSGKTQATRVAEDPGALFVSLRLEKELPHKRQKPGQD